MLFVRWSGNCYGSALPYFFVEINFQPQTERGKTKVSFFSGSYFAKLFSGKLFMSFFNLSGKFRILSANMLMNMNVEWGRCFCHCLCKARNSKLDEREKKSKEKTFFLLHNFRQKKKSAITSRTIESLLRSH